MSIIGEIKCEQKLLEENIPLFTPAYIKGYKDALDWVLKRIIDLKKKESE